MEKLRILVLGSAAGGGVPQWNCQCPVCALAWAGDPRVLPRTQSSLAISANGEDWWLLNASPDLRQQIIANPILHPRGSDRSSPIRGAILTNGDVDHIAGLLTLREQQALTLYGSGKALELLAAGSVFGVLNPVLVKRTAFELGQSLALGDGLAVKPFAVPGKAPLFLEDDDMVIGEETENTIGLEIRHNTQRLFYIPGCASLNPALLARIEGADALFFDGTTFTDDEMPRLGLSQKTAARMGHVAIGGETGSLKSLADTKIARKIYIHINNTNPVLISDSLAHRTVKQAGWDIAFDGMEITL